MLGASRVVATNPIFLARSSRPAAPGRRLAVKDLFDTADLETTYGSPVFAGHRPRRDAWAVAALRAAGWDVVGKTNLHEFAYGTSGRNAHLGTVRNPLDAGRLAGGSSSGSAAAVATGEADAALGTDSRGSVRIPAACCGVAGFKPTFGLVPGDGVFALAPSFDHVGPIAPSAAACAAVMTDLLPALEIAAPDLSTVRGGVVWTDATTPGVAAGVHAAARLLGAVADVAFPGPRDVDVRPAFRYEAAVVHRDLLAAHRARYGADVAAKLHAGLATPRAAYVDGLREIARLRRSCSRVFEEVDVLLAPVLPCVAPPLDAEDVGGVPINTALGSLTIPFNALGWP